MIPVILTGDSHSGPLKRGMALQGNLQNEPIIFWPLGGGGGAREVFFDADLDTVSTKSPKWRNRIFSQSTLREVSEDALLIVSMPLNTSRILRDYSWDTHVPWRLANSEITLSDAVVNALIEQDSRHTIGFALALKRIWPKIAVLEAPRFFRNASYLDSKRFDVCKYIDASYRSQVGRELKAGGIHVISQPAETIAFDGTTDLIFDNEDPRDDHHANAKYGVLALQSIVDYVSTL